ncbi:hypothetical protein ASC80_10670 [Afipia sp. Root123D2]|nr:hypothetical protein ASC80_10670 [Afipia sp. Root123D2]
MSEAGQTELRPEFTLSQFIWLERLQCRYKTDRSFKVGFGFFPTYSAHYVAKNYRHFHLLEGYAAVVCTPHTKLNK